jgi:hypothetical protein
MSFSLLRAIYFDDCYTVHEESMMFIGAAEKEE